MAGFFHSVTLDEAKCVGCTNCIKRCPTEAIRIRAGKAVIASERCIDCGECIRICPHHAKRAVYNTLDVLDNTKFNIALPAPTLYGQFNNLDDIDYILNGLKKIGFDYVYEVSRAAELVSEATRKLIKDGKVKKPVISSACPAIVRLIRVRFPDLIENVLPIKSPMEVAAYIVKHEIAEAKEIDINNVRCYFITPCPAKVTDIRFPIGVEKSMVDGAISIGEIFPKLSGAMDKLDPNELKPIASSGIIGVSWSTSGGEAAALLNDKYLAADGIENVIRVLGEVEDERIGDLDFIELNACSSGCVGGVLCVENPYVAKARIQKLRKYLPVSKNHLKTNDVPVGIKWNEALEYSNVLTLSSDLGEAMQMMADIDKKVQQLPGLDCGACGAPSCRAFAEDVVKGTCSDADCIFIYREKIRRMADKMSELGAAVFPREADDNAN